MKSIGYAAVLGGKLSSESSEIPGLDSVEGHGEINGLDNQNIRTRLSDDLGDLNVDNELTKTPQSPVDDIFAL